MPAIPAHTGPAVWGGPEPGTFHPFGSLEMLPDKASLGEALNAVKWSSTDTLAARIFVGSKQFQSKNKWRSRR